MVIPGMLLAAFGRLNLLRESQILSLRSFATASLRISAIKELREKSGAPIAEVKNALEEADYELDQAYQVLRTRGLAAASKKATRRAAEGLIGLARQDDKAALVEVNCETDFAARNGKFRGLVSAAAQAVLASATERQPGATSAEIDARTLGSLATTDGRKLDDLLQEVAGSMRENIRLRRAFSLDAPKGVIASYLHTSPASGLGRIGTLVAIEAQQQSLPESARAGLQETANKLAMHAAAARPLYLSRDMVPEAALEAEKAVLRDQAATSGKPASIVEKMVLGRLSKYYEEVCFLEQSFIMDDNQKVKDLLRSLSKDAGVNLAVTGFVRLQCGEGLDEEGAKSDFAAEVKSTLENVA